VSTGSQDVTVYTTGSCVYCQAQKRFLDEHKIPFKEVRVDTDTVAAEEMIKRSGQMSVPFTVIVNQTDETEREITGFNRLRLAKALGI